MQLIDQSEIFGNLWSDADTDSHARMQIILREEEYYLRYAGQLANCAAEGESVHINRCYLNALAIQARTGIF